MAMKLTCSNETVVAKKLCKVEMLDALHVPLEYLNMYPHCYKTYSVTSEGIYIKESSDKGKFIWAGDIITEEDIKVITNCGERLKKINERKVKVSSLASSSNIKEFIIKI